MKVELITEDELIERYNEMIDETTDTIKIGSIEFEPHQVLEELDPTAYNCGLNDYEDVLSDDGIYSKRSYNENDFFKCSECGTLYDDEDEAKECCEDWCKNENWE